MSDNDLIDRFKELLDAHSDVSKAHWKGLEQRVSDGFSGVNARLDKVNGRLDKQHDRLDEFEKEVAPLAADFEQRRLETLHQHRRVSDPPAKTVTHARREDQLPLTRRDAYIVLATLGCIGSVVGFVILVLPFLKKAVS